MIEENPFIVSLYLRGKDLDPKFVTAQLGVIPTLSHYKGEKRITSIGTEYATKIGIWAITTSSQSKSLSDHIAELASKFELHGKALNEITGVEESYIDIFISSLKNKCGSDTSEFEFNVDSIAALARLTVPIRFTVTFVEE
ncbi:MAG: DUF4279 domain-containing protein [Candidatus Nitrotoga sp.]